MASVEYPQNEFTRMIEGVASRNRSGGHGEGVASATPLPTAQSADLGREVPALAPLTDAENTELNRLAVEAGVRDPRLGMSAEEQQASYKSLEEAIEAGAFAKDLDVRVPVVGLAGISRQTAREFVGSRTRLPDFRRVEGIDLLRDVVMIDGMEFPISPGKALDFKQFVVTTARNAIMEKLNEASGLFALPAKAEVVDGGIAEATAPEVQRESEGGSAESAL